MVRIDADAHHIHPADVSHFLDESDEHRSWNCTREKIDHHFRQLGPQNYSQVEQPSKTPQLSSYRPTCQYVVVRDDLTGFVHEEVLLDSGQYVSNPSANQHLRPWCKNLLVTGDHASFCLCEKSQRRRARFRQAWGCLLTHAGPITTSHQFH